MFENNFPKKIIEYKKILFDYNNKINIYSKNSYEQLNFHIQDSINISSLLPKIGTHIDLGSGSGLPGIIIAIMTQKETICIESKEKKRKFLKEAKKVLELKNLDIFNGDVQSFAKTAKKHKISSISAKAFAKLPKVLTYLNLFRNKVPNKTSCWIPISKAQKDNLPTIFKPIPITINEVTFYYLDINFQRHPSYKAALKNQYDL